MKRNYTFMRHEEPVTDCKGKKIQFCTSNIPLNARKQAQISGCAQNVSLYAFQKKMTKKFTDSVYSILQVSVVYRPSYTDILNLIFYYRELLQLKLIMRTSAIIRKEYRENVLVTIYKRQQQKKKDKIYPSKGRLKTILIMGDIP